MKSTFAFAVVVVLVLVAPASNPARAAGAVDPPASSAEVYTRAIVRSISDDEQKRLYIRLKLVPRAKIPFSTLTYRVLDARLVVGLHEGDSVAFKAERLNGENVVTAIRAVPPCERFKECK